MKAINLRQYLPLKIPEEVSKLYSVAAPAGSLEAFSNRPCFAVKIRRRNHLNRALNFALITQDDALEILRHGGSLALWKGGSDKSPTVFFKLRLFDAPKAGTTSASVAVGRFLLDCQAGETCTTLDRNPYCLLRSNLKFVKFSPAVIPAREPTTRRLERLQTVTPQPILWSEYLVRPELIDPSGFTYHE
ncbi:hypothetical protein [Hyphomicrobium facile]|uniref:Uncharacterized protein n=1 Tax=Hyphomicrobium facile TaxID=51670 RepID=A0A1I7NH67_9HYPH|nr:hypothetical protein [Hyphomicrobium facile]SFV33988.1 hypothetical protein SAMN04488557_2177 [Hyphomicrobium facile]